jgi:hypothetical protein
MGTGESAGVEKKKRRSRSYVSAKIRKIRKVYGVVLTVFTAAESERAAGPAMKKL